MLKQVQHDEVILTSPIHHLEQFYVTLNTKEVRHPELVSGYRICLYVTLNLFQGLVFEMLNQVQHDEVVVASP
jgi:hypothetical protein